MDCRNVLYFSSVLIVAIIGEYQQNNYPVLQLEDGKFQGERKQIKGTTKSYYRFQGIPFAEPPIGNLRFMVPVPHKKWNGILKNNPNTTMCLQMMVEGNEDCLYLDVYTPVLTNRSLSVMVWIYGGNFNQGSRSLFWSNPETLMDNEVVVVKFNYRLGIFGFLSTGDLVLPGNLGLKDQILALRWVQKNIAEFGGDPKRVTVFGESAGSASVSYLLQTNLTRGAIMESGTSLCLWSLCRKPSAIAFEIGQILLVDMTNTSTLIRDLKLVPGHLLQRIAFMVYLKNLPFLNNLQGLQFAPVIELDHEGAVVTSKSHELFINGIFHKIPVIIGYNSQEAIRAMDIPILLSSLLKKYDISSSLVPFDMNINSLWTKRFVGDLIKKHYFGNSVRRSENIKLVQFLSDDQFNRPIMETVNLMSKYIPVYFYVFYKDGSLGHSHPRNKTGVGHAEELNYIFDSFHRANADDIVVKKMMIRMWTNFAKFRNPTPWRENILQNISWTPAGNIFNYLNITEKLSMGVKPNYQNFLFFKQLYENFGNPPYDTF